MKKHLLLILTLIVLIPIKTLAQSLEPGEASFSVDLSIILITEEVSSPYGGNPLYPNTTLSVEHPLGLEGRNPNYLKISWKAFYSDNIGRSINVFCYLNTKTQNCSFPNYWSGTIGSCTINNPTYQYNRNFNLVVCNFSSVEFPSLFGEVNRSLQPVAFYVSSAPGGMSVGQTFPWVVNVKNLGILDNGFKINITYDPTKASVNPSVGDTASIVEYGELTSFTTQINFLVTGTQSLTIYTRPLSGTTPCSSLSDCPIAVYSNPKCINNMCWSNSTISINVGFASLPEFGLLGFIQIAVLATIIFALLLRKKK